MKSNLIHFVLTGGTIDSYYNGIKDTAMPNKNQLFRLYFEFTTQRKPYLQKFV